MTSQQGVDLKVSAETRMDAAEPAATAAGRPASSSVQRQQRGELRRTAILRATWQVVLRDGVRGVRHRAVAEAAGVPLASTTYYFKDIHELLVQSFQLFAEEAYTRFTQPFWLQAAERMSEVALGPDDRRWSDLLTDLAADYIAQRLRDHREQAVMEYAFWYAALHEPELQPAVRDMALRWMGLLLPWLRQAGLRQPEQAARCVLATVRRIEYEALIESSATTQQNWIREALHYQIKGLW